ncbi:DNA-binding domain-containing protein [Rhodoferax sp.]|uniref:HvfC/BufC N-terminal domain-containing protein n=1 Tax=Rhodoferax sp. TaxID=50421 RepID=UPI00261E150C|nr:DNA-binding domain-containing protein [Rhodoferax sp.]MDD2808016.1 DNA-binding domain-containing protein [Rhodoferax sp.]MDD4942051.1 DNA-binding domain-containing protein [Rhodoferax sp.]MDD5478527.1 DNA-binding domain-containing protein [Rhodoferax sp.]
MSTQTAFAQAVLDAQLPPPSGLVTCNGSDPTLRFAVYRNNVMVSLIDALADTYPVVQTLVGEAFFRAMAREFAQNHPPRSAVMAYYGRNFADFVAAFPPVASVPYLADVARLEMARVLAYHAADVAAIDPQVLQAALANAQQLLSLQLVLHPSIQVIESSFAIVSVWTAHQGAVSALEVDPDVAQTALVYRAGLTVNTLALAAGTGMFVKALLAGQTLADAAQAASDLDPTFDLTHALTLLLRLQLITHLNTGDRA